MKRWEIINSILCNRKIISVIWIVHINVQLRPNILCEYKCFFSDIEHICFSVRTEFIGMFSDSDSLRYRNFFFFRYTFSGFIHACRVTYILHLNVERKQGVKAKITLFSLQQQQQPRVISEYVDSKADHRLGFVHVAPQNSSELVRLWRDWYVVMVRWYGPIHAPGDSCFRVGVNWTAARDQWILQNTGGEERQNYWFVWRKRLDSVIQLNCSLL